jgi:plasmid stabilization system protein ParE
VKVVRIDQRARREAKEAAKWYAGRGKALAARFGDELLAAFMFAAANPNLCPPYLHETRRAPLKKFPYFVVFFDWKDEIFIVAVAHAKRQEGYWRQRI